MTLPTALNARLRQGSGAVTLDSNTIAICVGCGVGGPSVPDSGSTLLLLASGLAALLGLGTLFAHRRRCLVLV